MKLTNEVEAMPLETLGHDQSLNICTEVHPHMPIQCPVALITTDRKNNPLPLTLTYTII